MGTSPRGLWIVLTLWMVVLRPSATVPPGTPASGWWGTPESKALQKNVGQHLRSGNFAAAEADFEVCLAGARQWHDPVSESRCLSGIAGTHTARFEYEKAFDVYLQARDVAAASGDRVDLGAVDFNLSSLFLQTSDDASALRSAEAAQAAIEGLPHVYYQPQLLWQLGALHQLREDQPGAPWLEQAIEAARAGEAGDKSLVAVEARIWDALGEEYMDAQDLDRAERAYLEAYRLRRLSPQHELGRRDLGFSYARLGALKLARAEALARTGSREPEALLDDAERLTLRAMEQPVTLPVFSLRYQLGRIRLAQGKRRAALDDLGAAADAALDWLGGVPAALSSLDKASGSISDVFATLVEAAAAYGLDTGDQAWIEQSFEAAEVGRAVNPRTSQGLSEVWRTRLPPSFWATLDKLRSVEASLIRSGARKNLASEQLKLELTEMEARAGLGFIPTNTENFHNRNSLNHFQQGIDESEVLLSFALGEQQGVSLGSNQRESQDLPAGPAGANSSGHPGVSRSGRRRTDGSGNVGPASLHDAVRAVESRGSGPAEVAAVFGRRVVSTALCRAGTYSRVWESERQGRVSGGTTLVPNHVRRGRAAQHARDGNIPGRGGSHLQHRRCTLGGWSGVVVPHGAE